MIPDVVGLSIFSIFIIAGVILAAYAHGKRQRDKGYLEALNEITTSKKFEFTPGNLSITIGLGLTITQEDMIHRIVRDCVKNDLIAGTSNRARTIVNLWKDIRLTTDVQRAYAIYQYAITSYIAITHTVKHGKAMYDLIDDIIDSCNLSEKLAVMRNSLKNVTDDISQLKDSDQREHAKKEAAKVASMLDRFESTRGKNVLGDSKGIVVDLSGLSPEERKKKILEVFDDLHTDGGKKEEAVEQSKPDDSTVSSIK